MKTRLICLLLTGALLLCMTGCVSKKKKSTSARSDNSFWPANLQWSEVTGLEDVRLKEILQKQKEEQDAFSDVSDALVGTVERNTYTNPHVGLGFTLNSDWTVFPARDLQDLTDFAQIIFSESDFTEYLSVVPHFLDVMALSDDGYSQINIVYQKQPSHIQKYFQEMTEEEFIDYLLLQKDILVDAYTEANFEVLEMTKKAVNFLGEPHFAVHTHATAGDTPYHMLQLINFDFSQYSVTITISSISEDNTEEILQQFYPVSASI